MPTKFTEGKHTVDVDLFGLLLTRHQVHAAFKNGILKALRTYNKALITAAKKYEVACKKAAENLQKDFNKL